MPANLETQKGSGSLVTNEAQTAPLKAVVLFDPEREFRMLSDNISTDFSSGRKIGPSRRDAWGPVGAGTFASLSTPVGEIASAPIEAGLILAPAFIGLSRIASRVISKDENAPNMWANINRKARGLFGWVGNIIRVPARFFVNRAMEPGSNIEHLIKNKERLATLSTEVKEEHLKSALTAKMISDNIEAQDTTGWDKRAVNAFAKYKEAGATAGAIFKDLVEKRALDRDEDKNEYAKRLLSNLREDVANKERFLWMKIVGASMIAGIIPAAVTAFGVDVLTGRTTAALGNLWTDFRTKTFPALSDKWNQITRDIHDLWDRFTNWLIPPQAAATPAAGPSAAATAPSTTSHAGNEAAKHVAGEGGGVPKSIVKPPASAPQPPKPPQRVEDLLHKKDFFRVRVSKPDFYLP